MTTKIGTATGFVDFIDQLEGFLTDAGHAWGLVDHADGNGRLSDIAGGVDSVHESITVTMLSDVDYQVQGSVSGNLGYGVVGTPYVDSHIEFTIESGSQPFVAGDYWTLSTSPAWTLRRRNLLTERTATGGGTSGSFSFHCLNDGLVSRGVVNDAWETTGTPPLEYIVTHESTLTVVEYGIAVAQSGAEPTEWTLDRWDGAAWVALDTRTGITWSPSDVGQYRVFAVGTPTAATRYRWRITARNGDRIDVGQFCLRTANGGINRIEEAVIVEAPGDYLGGGFIAGVKPLYRDDRDYFTLELFAMTSYSSGAELADQTGLHRNLYLPLWDDPMDFWLVARGSGVRGVIKLGSQYESFSIGLIEPYFPPNEWPLPLMLGGSLVVDTSEYTYQGAFDSAAFRHSVATRAHSAYPMAAIPPSIAGSANLFNTLNQQRAACRIRLADGSWRGMVANADGAANTITPWSESAALKFGVILPYWRGFGLTARSLSDQPILWPVIVGTAEDVLGELPGVRAVSGDGVSAETIITEDGVDYLVVPDITRSGFADFYALRLD